MTLQGICYVIIQTQTAYNEMIGNSSSAQCQYNVDF
ncbi:hypothetical protein [Shewanella sp. OMA3-2]|nr:hypothetical protein [Shewanella sp. OMA3-2]UJF22945.1 hypothetical protein L0B17_06125 [Shewanella sp. OMA3-2]